MRALFAVVVFATGCSKLLGITDPSTGGDGGVDAGETGLDAAFDAPPPCAPSPVFGGVQVVELGAVGTSIAYGRLDREIGLDLAIAVGDRVLVLGGDQNGNFAPAATLTVDADRVLVADVDDGDDDIIAWRVGGDEIYGFLQNSATNPSTWSAAQVTTGPSGLRQVLPGYFDGNFYVDLIVGDAQQVRAYHSSQLSYGTFNADAVAGAAGDEVVGYIDVDRDNRDDALLRRGQVVKIAFHQGSGFATSVVIDDEASNVFVAGHFDDDTQHRDVIAASGGEPGTLYRQLAARVFTEQPGVAVPGLGSLAAGATVRVLDLNGDGTEDLVRAGGATLQCRSGEGIGVFTQLEALPISDAFVAVDLDGDTKPDLAWLEGNQLKVRLQQ